MIGKKTRSVGYLMEILNISSTNLAKAVHVDRTTVSKWKTGIRPFDANSQYYEPVVNYFISVDQKQNQGTLEKFFKNIYPAEPVTDGYIRKNIDRFLLLVDIPETVYNLVSVSSGCMYYSNAPIYSNAYGRFSALCEMLSMIESSKQKLELVLFDNEQFEWLMKNEGYFKNFIAQMLRILNQGHDVTIISNSYYNIDVYKKFSISAYVFYSYKNYREYHFTTHINPRLLFTSYFTKNHMAITGYNLHRESDDLYTIVMKDPYTILYAQSLLQELMNSCTPILFPKNNAQRFDIFRKIKEYENIDEVCYMFSPSLSFTTMSKQLLLTILKENGVYGAVREEAIALYDCVNQAHQKNQEIPMIRHICFYDIIKKRLNQEQFCLDELSVLLGKTIMITKTQFRVHIQDTIDKLAEHQNYALGITKRAEVIFPSDYSCRCKKNFYAVSCQKCIKYAGEVNAVNATFSLFDKIWNHMITAEYKQKQFITEQLLQLLQNG